MEGGKSKCIYRLRGFLEYSPVLFISSNFAWKSFNVVYRSTSFSSSYWLSEAHAPNVEHPTFFATVKSLVKSQGASFWLQEVGRWCLLSRCWRCISRSILVTFWLSDTYIGLFIPATGRLPSEKISITILNPTFISPEYIQLNKVTFYDVGRVG